MQVVSREVVVEYRLQAERWLLSAGCKQRGGC